MRIKRVKCPECHGEGGFNVPILFRELGGGEFRTCSLCNRSGSVSQKTRMEYVRGFKKKEINKCPRCKSENLDLKGWGESLHGRYEHYEWVCEDCGYSEEQYIYDSVPEMQVEDNHGKN